MWIAVKQQYQFDVSITSRGAGVLGKKRFELQFKKWYQFEARVASHGAGMLCKKDLNSSLKNNTSLQLKTSQKKKKIFLLNSICGGMFAERHHAVGPYLFFLEGFPVIFVYH